CEPQTYTGGLRPRRGVRLTCRLPCLEPRLCPPGIGVAATTEWRGGRRPPLTGDTPGTKSTTVGGPRPMAKMTGAQILLECLQREGVDTIFGYPGGVVLPLYDTLPQ